MMPSACSAMMSKSIRGHLPSWPSIEARELSRNRFFRPTALRAHIVMWVIAPLPEMSSLFCSGRPHLMRLLVSRDSGAT